MKRFAVISVVLIVLIAGCTPQSDITVIKNGLLFTGTGAEPIENGLVAFQGETIVFAGPEDDYTIPKGARVLDAEGGMIMPGVIDAHTHGNTNQLPMKLEDMWTRTGVTSLRCMGVENLRTREDFDSLQQRMQSDYVLPHIVAAGPIITNLPERENSVFEVVSTGDEARQFAQGLLDAGADLLKVIVFTEADDQVREMLASLIDVAHANGVRVTGDFREMSVIEAAVDLGIDELAHTPLDVMSDQLIEAMVDKEIIMLSTLSLWQELDENNNYPENVRRFLDAGGIYALGTDYGSGGAPPPGMPLHEFTAMKEHGLSEEEILFAATANAAKALGLEASRGTLQTGKVADIIVVDGNPLEDTGALANLRFIVVRGNIVE